MTTKQEALDYLSRIKSACDIEGGVYGCRVDDVRSFILSTPDWQDIATAPKDGSMFMTWDGRNRCIDYFDLNEGALSNLAMERVMRAFDGGEGLEVKSVTHWMPLPAPPAPEVAG